MSLVPHRSAPPVLQPQTFVEVDPEGRNVALVVGDSQFVFSTGSDHVEAHQALLYRWAMAGPACAPGSGAPPRCWWPSPPSGPAPCASAPTPPAIPPATGAATHWNPAPPEPTPGGAAFDPEVVRQLLARTTHTAPLARLTGRERDVLAQMAQGYTNSSIAQRLVVSQSAVEKHVNAIFTKLDLSHVSGYSRRVLAVLRYLDDLEA